MYACHLIILPICACASARFLWLIGQKLFIQSQDFFFPSLAAYSRRRSAFKNGHNCLPRFLRAFGDTKNIIIRTRNFNVLHRPVSQSSLYDCSLWALICEKPVCKWTAWVLHCWNVWFILLFSSKIFHLLQLLHLRNCHILAFTPDIYVQFWMRWWGKSCITLTRLPLRAREKMFCSDMILPRQLRTSNSWFSDRCVQSPH